MDSWKCCAYCKIGIYIQAFIRLYKFINQANGPEDRVQSQVESYLRL